MAAQGWITEPVALHPFRVIQTGLNYLHFELWKCLFKSSKFLETHEQFSCETESEGECDPHKMVCVNRNSTLHDVTFTLFLDKRLQVDR